MLPKMTCMQYNMWCSIIRVLQDELPHRLSNITKYKEIPVLPTYPKLEKKSIPSIIVQPIFTSSTSIGMGGTLGQYSDIEDYSVDSGIDGDTIEHIYDVYGKLWKAKYNIFVLADNNFDRAIISDMIEDVISNPIGNEIYKETHIPLRAFHNNTEDEIGNMKRLGNITNVMNAVEDDNYDEFITATFVAIQSIIDENQGYINLRKRIKQKFKIII